jgi:hypothetical protein
MVHFFVFDQFSGSFGSSELSVVSIMIMYSRVRHGALRLRDEHNIRVLSGAVLETDSALG